MGYFDNAIAGVDMLWSWVQQYALADHYFQSVIGEASTNQLYMVAADDNNVVHPVPGGCPRSTGATTRATIFAICFSNASGVPSPRISRGAGILPGTVFRALCCLQTAGSDPGTN